ncbi:MAG: hypothetical protein ABEK29_04305 [Bradymonadaceae bacterium]
MPTTRRPIRHWLGLLIAGLGLCWVSSAAATTALKLDLQSLVANSNAIVLGDVTDVRSFKKDGRIYTDTTVRVDEAWKGDATDTVTIRHPGGRIGDTVTRVFGLPGFEPDERVVVFLRRARASSSEGEPQASHFTVTGLRQGKFRVTLGPDKSTEFVVPRLGDIQLLEPKDDQLFKNKKTSDGTDSPTRKLKKLDAGKLETADPAPIHEKVLTLEDFRERVRRAVAPPSEGGNQ